MNWHDDCKEFRKQRLSLMLWLSIVIVSIYTLYTLYLTKNCVPSLSHTHQLTPVLYYVRLNSKPFLLYYLPTHTLSINVCVGMSVPVRCKETVVLVVDSRIVARSELSVVIRQDVKYNTIHCLRISHGQ